MEPDHEIRLYSDSSCSLRVPAVSESYSVSTSQIIPVWEKSVALHFSSMHSGTYNFYAQVSDLAGNTSTCKTISYILDVDKPSTPTISLASSGSDPTPAVTLASLRESDTVTVYYGANCDPQHVVLGPLTIGSEASLALAVPSDHKLTSSGSIKYSVKTTGPYFDESDCAESENYAFTLDETPPSGFTASMAASGYESRPEITVSAIAEDDVVKVYLGGSCEPANLAGGPFVSISTEIIVQPTVRPNSSGSYQYQVIVSDESDNEAPCTALDNPYQLTLIDMERQLTSLALGDRFTCAIKSGPAQDSLNCWGSNNHSRLGVEVGGDQLFPYPADFSQSTRIAQVMSGSSSSCLVTVGGDLYCWGYNNAEHILGSQITLSERPQPTLVASLAGRVTEVAIGEHHMCALLKGGKVNCWGKGEYGTLGHNSYDDAVTGPVAVHSGENDPLPLSHIVQIAVGDTFSCALHNAGQVKCWGRSKDGRLGNGESSSSEHQNYPGDVLLDGGDQPLSDIIEIGASLGGYACAIQIEGDVYCWGNGNDGTLGDGTANSSNKARQVPSLTGVVKLALGKNHACALKDNGSVVCWGKNHYGVLGDGSSGSEKKTLVYVKAGQGSSENLTGVVQVVAGIDHTCALMENALLKCWGAGTWGKLGNGDTGDMSYPTTVRIAEGESHDQLYRPSTSISYYETRFSVNLLRTNTLKFFLDSSYSSPSSG